MTTIDIGERIDLKPYYENLTRRDFLRLSGAAAGSLSLSGLIERFSGLSDETGLLSTVSANYPGQKSGSGTAKITKTVKDNGITHSARTEERHTEGGDSGGPWVDDDDYYLGILHGANYLGDGYDVVAVAGPVFDAVNVKLYHSGDPTK